MLLSANICPSKENVQQYHYKYRLNLKNWGPPSPRPPLSMSLIEHIPCMECLCNSVMHVAATFVFCNSTTPMQVQLTLQNKETLLNLQVLATLQISST